MTRRPLPAVCTFRRAILLTASLLALTLPRPASAATITVDTFAQGSVAGCSFAEAITSINNGANTGGCVAVVVPDPYGTNDTIILPFGTYNFTVAHIGVNALPIITVSVTINGNGSTLARTLGNVAPFFRFIEVTGGILTLNSLTLTGGNPGAGNFGGAILDSSTGTLTITNGTFSGNTAQEGGAIFKGVTGGLIVTSSTFVSNSATSSTSDAEGGAIKIGENGGTVSVTSSTFTNNRATSSGADADGGAIEVDDSGTVTVTSSTFLNNRATSSGADAEDGAIGGAIKIEGGGSLSVTSSIFVGNGAFASGPAGAVGGGLGLPPGEFSGSGVVNNNCFVGNTAQSGGGVFKGSPPDVNAESNWWGAANGPSEEGPGSGDGVSSNVDFIPFLTSAPFAGCNALAIPTLSEWAQLGMVALLIVGGLLALRRTKRAVPTRPA